MMIAFKVSLVCLILVIADAAVAPSKGNVSELGPKAVPALVKPAALPDMKNSMAPDASKASVPQVPVKTPGYEAIGEASQPLSASKKTLASSPKNESKALKSKEIPKKKPSNNIKAKPVALNKNTNGDGGAISAITGARDFSSPIQVDAPDSIFKPESDSKKAKTLASASENVIIGKPASVGAPAKNSESKPASVAKPESKPTSVVKPVAQAAAPQSLPSVNQKTPPTSITSASNPKVEVSLPIVSNIPPVQPAAPIENVAKPVLEVTPSAGDSVKPPIEAIPAVATGAKKELCLRNIEQIILVDCEPDDKDIMEENIKEVPTEEKAGEVSASTADQPSNNTAPQV